MTGDMRLIAVNNDTQTLLIDTRQAQTQAGVHYRLIAKHLFIQHNGEDVDVLRARRL